jgi:hypothetical protein
MDGSSVERGDKGRDIFGLLLDREIITFTVPVLWPAMPKADRNCSVMRSEVLHLLCPMTVISERTMYEEKRYARPTLDECHLVSVHM